MVCKILFRSEFFDIPEKSWRRRWRKPANVKRFASQANPKKTIKKVKSKHAKGSIYKNKDGDYLICCVHTFKR